MEESIILELKEQGLTAEVISAEQFFKGIVPHNFEAAAGASYKPSHNEDPKIPAQCWIETGYGTQNACKYCHTDYLSSIGHGNSFPIAEDQIFYSFPSSNLNRILWQNIIYPQNIESRLKADGIEIPHIDDVEYVRVDNWLPTYSKVRGDGNDNWLIDHDPANSFVLFPALNPNHLFPYNADDPTHGNAHGYIDEGGFIQRKEEYTGWRAVNFFPYAIFSPLTGSVSGIYIRLPREYMQTNGKQDINTYKQNLDILEKNIKNQPCESTHYLGDAAQVRLARVFTLWVPNLPIRSYVDLVPMAKWAHR